MKSWGSFSQQYNLLPRMSILENVEVPLMYAGMSKAGRREIAKAALANVGLGDKLKKFANPALRRSAAAGCPSQGL